MEKTFMKLKCGGTYFNIHRKPNSYYASLYGQLEIPFADYLEKETLIDLIITITIEHYRVNVPLQIFNETTSKWSNF